MTAIKELCDRMVFVRVDLDKPEFEKAGRVHDWRNYVPSEIQEIWNELSTEAKMVASIIADDVAGREEWD